MEDTKRMSNVISLSAKREENKNRVLLDPNVTEVVNKLFGLFYILCRGFEKQYADSKRLNAEKTQWIRAFMDTELNTLEKIKFGIKKLRLETPINTPPLGKFLKWCIPTPEELGIPGIEEAYREAVTNSYFARNEKKWTHKAIYHAWRLCNSFELSNLPKTKSFPIFEHHYEIIIQKLVRGEVLKEIPEALPSPSSVLTEQEKAKAIKARAENMAKLREILGMKNGRAVVSRPV